jgi:hypothetical protein
MMPEVQGPNDESFADFYANWLKQQEEHLLELRAALGDGSNIQEPELKNLVQKVLAHYEEYYTAKDGAAQQDVLKVVQSSWKTPLENAFMFIGGWRPTMVCQLAYAQAGQQIEAQLAEFLSGIDTPGMVSLSSKQLLLTSNLQQLTQKCEEDFEHRMAVLQQGLVDQPLLSLAQGHWDHHPQMPDPPTLSLAQAGEHQRAEEEAGGNDHETEMESAMDDKVKALKELVTDADAMRLKTLKDMLHILNLVQSAQYLVAAAQIQIAIRHLGVKQNGIHHSNEHDTEA